MAFLIDFRRRWLAGAAVAMAMFGVVLGFDAARAWADGGSPGAVYSLTNAAAGNQLAVFQRNAQGGLTLAGMVPTGGLGTGSGLGSQGALALGANGRTLYAVNAGSNSITVFRLRDNGPKMIQVIDSGGILPISLAVRSDLLYVLNAGGNAGGVDQITGFHIGALGLLERLPNSSLPLSAPTTNPAQVGFSTDGGTLVVTEKNTNLIDTYVVGRNGYATGPNVQHSSGTEPFGFRFNKQGYLIVSEAFGGSPSAASSYQVDRNTGALTVVSPSVPAEQNAACWVAVTDNGKLAFTSNTASGTITGFSVASTGALTRLDANGLSGMTGGAPADSSIVGNRYLYVLAVISGEPQVFGFMINRDGSLVSLGSLGGLPPGSAGLLAE
jgi:6-phosphogluconolactonase (cycloisomerase 2 family)